MPLTEHQLDHRLYHRTAPRATCSACMLELLPPPDRAASCGYCGASGQPAMSYERAEGNGTWARTTCQLCSRRVNVSRATRRMPWNLIGRHTPPKRGNTP